MVTVPGQQLGETSLISPWLTIPSAQREVPPLPVAEPRTAKGDLHLSTHSMASLAHAYYSDLLGLRLDSSTNGFTEKFGEPGKLSTQVRRHTFPSSEHRLECS